jgi:hypothetical protein
MYPAWKCKYQMRALVVIALLLYICVYVALCAAMFPVLACSARSRSSRFFVVVGVGH